MIRVAIAEDNQLEKKKKAAEAAGRPDLNVLFICNMPFRAISKMTAGSVDGKMVEGMVDIVNGHFFVGAGKIISGYFTNRHENRKQEIPFLYRWWDELR